MNKPNYRQQAIKLIDKKVSQNIGLSLSDLPDIPMVDDLITDVEESLRGGNKHVALEIIEDTVNIEWIEEVAMG